MLLREDPRSDGIGVNVEDEGAVTAVAAVAVVAAVLLSSFGNFFFFYGLLSELPGDHNFGFHNPET